MENNYFYYSVPTGGTKINYTTNSTINDKVEEYELIDRYIAERLILDNIKKGATNITIEATPIKCSVDLKCSCELPVPEYNTTSTCNFNVEIKTINKTEEQFEKYPEWMLRVSKWQRMKNESKGRNLYYLVLCPTNKKGYLFNVDDMTGIRREWKWMKRTQVDPNSDYIQEEIFQIPIERAKKIVDLTEYYADYTKAN